jgi:hypothetical protein
MTVAGAEAELIFDRPCDSDDRGAYRHEIPGACRDRRVATGPRKTVPAMWAETGAATPGNYQERGGVASATKCRAASSTSTFVIAHNRGKLAR